MKKLLLSLLLLSTFQLHSQNLLSARQNSYFTSIYRVTNDEAETLYNKFWLKESMFHSLVDQYPTDSIYKKELPTGHYVFVHAVGNRLHAELESVDNLSLTILNNHQDLIVLFHDKNGDEIQSLTPTIGIRSIPYSSQLNAYKINTTNRQGLIKAEYQGHYNYFSIDRRYNNTLPARTKRRVLGTFPINHLISPFIYLGQTIQGLFNYRNISAPGIYHRTHNIFEPKVFTGYAVLNKPLFKPADTIKLKFFVTNKNGKPIKKNAAVMLSGYNPSHFNKELAKIEPYRDGGYSYSFVLADSFNLPLDRNYTLTLTDKKQNRYPSVQFHYEQYELKQNHYSLRNINNENNKPAIIMMKGTDSNDQPLYDVRVLITVFAKSLNAYEGKTIFLKDTLWTHELKLDPVGETRVALPDSFLIRASFHYEIQAVFMNAENERDLKSITATYNPLEDSTRWKIKNDSLWVIPSNNTSLYIKALHANHQEVWQQALQDTLAIKIDPYIQAYHITDANKTLHEVNMNQFDDGLAISGQRTIDSIMISCNNPAKIYFRYQLFKNNRIIESGVEQTVQIARSARKDDRYYLAVQYLWAGAARDQNFDFPFAQKPLNINIQHQPTAFPGEKVDFTVTVKDVYNQPVEDADVTAYAITKKFRNMMATTTPQYEKFKSRKVFNEFSEQSLSFNVNNYLQYPFWKERFGLDSLAYFQFLYPGKNIYLNTIAAEDSITQIAPFIWRGGWDQQPTYIEINNQIVFYQGNESHQPYSFPIQPGNANIIVIRLPYQRITLKNIAVTKGVKHILSVDLNHLPDGVVVEKLKKPYLSSIEKQKINNSFITIERKGQLAPVSYFQQEQHYHVLKFLQHWEQRNVETVGPFLPGTVTWYQNNDTVSFPFKPGFHYKFNKKVLEVTPNILHKQLDRRINYHTRSPSLSDQVLTASRVKFILSEAESKKHFIVKKYPDNKPVTPRIGSIEINDQTLVATNQRLATFILNLDIPDEFYIFPGTQTSYGPILPGNYQVIVLYKDEAYCKPQPIHVQAYGRTWLQLNDERLHPADSFSQQIIRQIKQWSQEGNYISHDRLKELQQMRTLYYRESAATTPLTGGRWITGVIREGQDPLPGVNVVVKGTTLGTVTNENGEYRLYVPYGGALVISFIGYATEEIEIENQNFQETDLQPDVAQLSEVVVVGYGSVQRASLTASVTTLSGKVAGVSGGIPGVSDDIEIRIRGASSFANSGNPLIVVDGVAYNSFDDIDPSKITSVEVLKSDAAVALYGSRASNGVILVSTKPGVSRTALLQTKLPDVTVPLQDLANNGSTLRKNFRDDAFWQPTLRTDKNGEAAFTATLPDDITGWNIHLLAMASNQRTGTGNSKLQAFKPLAAQLAVPNFLVQGDSSIALGKLTNYTSDSLLVKRRIDINKIEFQHQALLLQNNWLDSIPVSSTVADSIEIKYAVILDKYTDGELRKIPVLPIGSLESSGLFVALPRDTTFSYKAPAKGPINIHAQADLLDVLLKEIESLKQYPYECNEQLASKLKALLAEKVICNYQKKKFKYDKETEKIIRQLIQHQHEKGGWSWWGREEGRTWITMHVVEALLWARQLTYNVQFDEEGMKGFLLTETNYTSWTDQLDTYLFLAELGESVSMESLADSVNKYQPSLTSKLKLQRLYQLQNRAVDWSVVDSSKHETLKGNWYWGESNMSLWRNDVENSLLVYRMMEKEKRDEKNLFRLQHYFLEKRNSRPWNTFEASRIIETILPSLLKQQPEATKPKLVINGKVIDQFPHERIYNDTENLTITKNGAAPIYFSAYQQHWNTTPEKVAGDFVVNTQWKGNATNLSAGKPITLEVHLEVKRDAEYMMLNVPIPAGCTYHAKSQHRINGEVHREYDTHEVRVYCESLRAGKYTYRIELLPRYAGNYTINPAKAEWMYFPVIYGRSELKKIQVK